MTPRPDELPVDVANVMSGLKDFQRTTVEYVFRRMYLDNHPTSRFLVADEVGLGKTLVARGLIAQAIEHLWPSTQRIDVLYICSNADIARQNIRRLNVTGREDFQLASRITMLPTVIGDLRNNCVNFASFTPTTSFELHSSEGVRNERAVLYDLLHQAWDFRDHIGPLRVLQGQAASTDDFRKLTEYYQKRIEPMLRDAFLVALDAQASDHGRPEAGLRSRFDELREYYRRVRNPAAVPAEVRYARRKLVGDLRQLLAETCLHALEPDLIILDEFQRFKQLLDGETDALGAGGRQYPARH